MSASRNGAMALVAALQMPCGVLAADRVPGDLADLSLEELGNVEITSVSKRAERLSDAAASVYVITAEDIRCSGVTRLTDALRLAPNLQVAQSSASSYAISARGFNNSTANKLLVMIDGRSVYTPLFSGVFWDAQDVMLEDVERIEVISGPGGTLWGANAVNGVINIITRTAKRTQGTLAAAGTGNRESELALRHGATIGADGSYRFYGEYFDRDHTFTANGSAKNDAWYKSQIGFRADWDHGGDQLMAQGNAYSASEAQPFTGNNSAPPPASLSGVNLVTRWARVLEGGSSISVQAYYDRAERTIPPTFAETLDIVDVQVQHSLQTAGIHAVTWGTAYRYGWDRVANSNVLAFLPARVNQKWASIFAQDEIALRKELRLTVGARLERNDYTGNEFLPTARLAWKFAPDHLLWTAASRAIRAPSRLDRDTFVPAQPPFLVRGGPTVRSEVANVYELGYRRQAANRFSYSATLFHTDYDHLRTQEISPSRTFIVFASEMEGKSDGVEMWGTYQISRAWRLAGGFSALREKLRLKPGSNDATAARAQQGRDPARTGMFRSSLDLNPRGELDLTVRQVSALSNPEVASYVAVDIRWGWRLTSDVELSVTGQNLAGNGHGEFGDAASRSEIARSVVFKIVSRF